MPALKDTKTEANLKEAFAGESQANRRYLYFAQKADVEGYPDVAALFRSVAEGETGHAFGHFDFLRETGDPVTGVPVGPTEDNLKSAVEGETYEYSEMYPGFSPHRPGRGVRRDRRVVRDAGPRGEEPRRSVLGRTGLGFVVVGNASSLGSGPVNPWRSGRPRCDAGAESLRRPVTQPGDASRGKFRSSPQRTKT